MSKKGQERPRSTFALIEANFHKQKVLALEQGREWFWDTKADCVSMVDGVKERIM